MTIAEDNLAITSMPANPENGDVVHNAAIEALAKALTDMVTVEITSDQDYTLDSDEWTYLGIKVTDSPVTLTGPASIIVPAYEKLYVLKNDTAQTLTVTTGDSDDTGADIEAGTAGLVHCDGTLVQAIASGGSGGGGGGSTWTELTGVALSTASSDALYKTITATTTFTDSLSSGDSLTLKLINGGDYTVTFPTATWIGGEPILGALDFIQFWKDGSGLFAVHVDAEAQDLDNLLLNHDFAYNQREVTTASDTDYIHDGWVALTESNDIGISTQTNNDNGIPSNALLTQSNATAQRIGLGQFIESGNCIAHRGGPLSCRFRLKSSSAITLNYALVEWTGTSDAPTSDPISTWGGTLTYATNFTQLDAGSITLSAADTWETTDILTASAGSSMNNLLLLVWSNATLAQNETIGISRAQLHAGTSLPAWRREDRATALARCRRWYQPFDPVTLRCRLSDGAGTNGYEVRQTWLLGTPMRATPTLAYRDAAANATRVTVDATDNIALDSGSITATTDSIEADFNVAVGSAGNDLVFQVELDASL